VSTSTVESFDFQPRTRIVFGPGSLEDLPDSPRPRLAATAIGSTTQ